MFHSGMLITTSNFNLWMGKEAQTHPCKWTLLSNKKEHDTDTNNDMDKSQMY